MSHFVTNVGVEVGFRFPRACLIPLTPEIGASVVGSKRHCECRGRGSSPLPLTKNKDNGILADGPKRASEVVAVMNLLQARGDGFGSSTHRFIEHLLKRFFYSHLGKYVGPGVVSKFLTQSSTRIVA